jgi:hypothetical protein
MEESRIKELCISLMKADTEEEVIQLLKDAGYWDNNDVWRFYGDYENNYNTIGNQMSKPENALVEKLVNSVDARLMNECLVRNLDPEGSSAPQSIRQAVAQFFEEDLSPNRSNSGLIQEWDSSKRTAVARGITLAVTGAKPTSGKGNPCFVISDCGEGQTPEMMPDTLLSLTRSNKLRIPFVQGKFNQGGSGVLKFCGKHHLQLVLSRRNPRILNGNLAHESDTQWSFTIVRRHVPEGGIRNSIYAYLAPVGVEINPDRGGVLRFSADTMPILPEGQEPYAREADHGTLIKLYEYRTKARTHMFRRGGLQERLDILLADIALPIRLYECRPFGGKKGSFETTLSGIRVRLNDDKAENLEPGFPDSSMLQVAGEEMRVTIYAFKKGKAKTYRQREGIIFTVNGQMQGDIPDNFFERKKVGLRYLSDSILVVVDCSNLSTLAREDLFMNSRDRLSEGELRSAIEEELEDLLKRHTGLRELRERRRREEIESKLDDSKPLADILESILKHSPTLSMLFRQGKRVSTPFKTTNVESNDEFQGKRYPTYFKFKDITYGEVLHRNCHINIRCRIKFETDAVNDYFSRPVDPGDRSLFIISNGSRLPVRDYTMNLRNGIASLNVRLPANCREGDRLRFVLTVTDPTQIDPFENSFVVDVMEPTVPGTGGGNGRGKPPGRGQGKDRELPSGIALPPIIEVLEDEWDKKDPPFDQYTALRIKHGGSADESNENGNSRDIYDFYINMDNAFLKSELKTSSQEIAITRAQFKYGMVLLGLALLHDDADLTRFRAGTNGMDYEEDAVERDIERDVEEFTRAVAPVLLPMIEALGGLDLENV